MGHTPRGHLTIASPPAPADAQSRTLAMCTPSNPFPDQAPTWLLHHVLQKPCSAS